MTRQHTSSEAPNDGARQRIVGLADGERSTGGVPAEASAVSDQLGGLLAGREVGEHI